MKKLHPFGSAVCGHAQEVLHSIADHYRIAPALLIRVIVESVLDAASEDGAMQRELAEATRFLRETGHVPDCWLELEGARYEDGPDDSGMSEDDREDAPAFRPVGWELEDNHVVCAAMLKHPDQSSPRFSSLVDA